VWNAAGFDGYTKKIRGLPELGGSGSAPTAGGRTLERLVLTHSLLRGTREQQSRILEALGCVGSKCLELKQKVRLGAITMNDNLTLSMILATAKPTKMKRIYSYPVSRRGEEETYLTHPDYLKEYAARPTRSAPSLEQQEAMNREARRSLPADHWVHSLPLVYRPKSRATDFLP
jgi:hypothetical protein